MILITEQFYAKMTKDGRILIPKLILTLIGNRETDLSHYILNVSIEPA